MIVYTCELCERNFGHRDPGEYCRYCGGQVTYGDPIEHRRSNGGLAGTLEDPNTIPEVKAKPYRKDEKITCTPDCATFVDGLEAGEVATVVDSFHHNGETWLAVVKAGGQLISLPDVWAITNTEEGRS